LMHPPSYLATLPEEFVPSFSEGTRPLSLKVMSGLTAYLS
jgi:hypothetical protein